MSVAVPSMAGARAASVVASVDVGTLKLLHPLSHSDLEVHPWALDSEDVAASGVDSTVVVSEEDEVDPEAAALAIVEVASAAATALVVTVSGVPLTALARVGMEVAIAAATTTGALAMLTLSLCLLVEATVSAVIALAVIASAAAIVPVVIVQGGTPDRRGLTKAVVGMMSPGLDAVTRTFNAVTRSSFPLDTCWT